MPDESGEAERPLTTWRVAKVLLPFALTCLIASVGYIHTTTVAAISTAIRKTTDEYEIRSRKVQTIDDEQNKRTNRLAVVERDVKNLREDTKNAITRIERGVERMDAKIDRLLSKGKQ